MIESAALEWRQERLGGIARAGNRYLGQMLVVGAMAVIRHAERHGTREAIKAPCRCQPQASPLRQ